MSDGGTGPNEETLTPREEIASAFSVAREDPHRAEELLREVVLAAPDDPTVHWALARFLHDGRGEIDGAEASYRRALELEPRHVKALSDYARLVHYHRDDLDRAEGLYERAAAAAPKDASVISDLAHFVEHERRDLDRAEVLYERALAADPADPESLEAWARFLHHARRDAVRAREAYRRAIAASPDRADLRAWNAVFLQTLGADPDAARAAFEDALALDPEDGFALSNFALFSWSHDQDLDRADALFVRALAVEPDRWSTHWWRAAFLHEARGDRARAARHYRRAVELQPAHSTLLRQYQLFLEGAEWERSSVGDEPRPSLVDAISDRGYRLEQGREVTEAEAAYVEALEADPDHGPTLRRFASLLEREGRFDDAERLLRRAVELAPRDGWAHGLLARFLSRQRRELDGADEHYRQAIAAGLHDPKWLGEYARFLHEERADRERAEKYWRRALEADPSPDVVVDYARALEATRPDEAERLLRLAIERSPDDVYPLRQYARFLEEVREDVDEAELWYARAVERAPADALSLDAYARFLERRREDDLRAASHYLRAARAEPERAGRWAVVVRFLLERGLVDEALGSLRRWIDRATPRDEFAPVAEASFYGLVYFPHEGERAACFDRLKALLADEADLGRWDPAPHLEHLRESGRPDVPWVERLASTLVDRMR
ncbi:MAG: tetratricopeptide repeat protein [Sandaracinaceae bacterium]|nr:tetratricopeptide repeat protein [Sandaracinaceae bacterium]